MAKDWLQGVKDAYDVIVIGSGLGGLTAANHLAKLGQKVLLLEHHYQYGGLATWFKRRGGHTFDISLHGFPVGMIKSCRRYWTQEIADSIHQLKDVRFINPQMNVWTTFDRDDFTKLLTEKFGAPLERVESFYNHLRQMNFYDNDQRTTRELFEEFFPGRDDIHRLLMEPISYANGSSWEDPAITFGIVFSNFMSKGVYTFKGGTDHLVGLMVKEMEKNGVELRKCSLVEEILTEKGTDGKHRVVGLRARSQNSGESQPAHTIRCRAVLSNANIKNTVLKLAGRGKFRPAFVEETEKIRLNWSSCQVYMGIREGESIPHIGDLVFTSKAPKYSTAELTDLHTSSHTFSVYYDDTRPQTKVPRYAVVSSINARYADWASLDEESYQREKKRLCDEALESLEEFIPDIRSKVDHIEAATPRTVEHFTTHFGGASFGTKFEGLKVSMSLSDELTGLYHAGSVGIIMSGWLGTINYGIITASKLDKFLDDSKKAQPDLSALPTV